MENTIANLIKQKMKDKGVNAQYLINNGVNRQQVYSVLRMGKTLRPNYKISTLIEILEKLELEINFKTKKDE